MTNPQDLRLYIKHWGAGSPLVLLHGGASTSAQWNRLGPLLEDRCHIIAPDLIGCGKTAAWPRDGIADHDAQADLVAAAITDEQAAPVALVGHSLGGAIAVRLVLRYPELVSSLVLIEPALVILLREIGDALFNEYKALAESFVAHAKAGRDAAAWAEYIDYRQGAGKWEALSEDAKARVVALTASGAEALLSNLVDPTTVEDCRRIAVPTTVICGERTTAPDRRVAELLRDVIPESHYETIAGAGHMSPVTHPENVARAISGHLARCREPEGGGSVGVKFR